MIRCWLAFACLVPPLAAQTVELEPVAVTAARLPQTATEVPFSVTVLTGNELRALPAVTVDDALRVVPAFSLFRRSDSFTANPTTQGVSLRGLGPSGASRSLVLLDGVPLNDPFGGWIAWSLVPHESLAAAEVLRGGGGTAWGNAALGGVVQLLTAPPSDPLSRGAVSIGAFSTHSAELAVTQQLGPGTLQLSGRDFSTDGFSLVAPENRGPVDVAARSRHDWLAARWSQPVGGGSTLSVTARSFAEQRGNGTPYQRNSSRQNFGSASLTSQPLAAFTWTATVYAQDEDFASTYSSVNATRTAETPASNQFAVPATAFGAAWTGTWRQPNGVRMTAGADYRRVSGETREDYGYVSDAYTRRRIAGGTQDTGGLFLLREQPLVPGLKATVGVRLDAWDETDGHRRESVLATGVLTRDDAYPDLNHIEFSPSVGLVWETTSSWRLHASAQQAFRRPTLNELYRPFRAGSVVTEANPALRTEHVTSTEVGADWTRREFTLGVAFFWNDLRDAVGNVTVATGPGTSPLFGVLAAGATGRERLNIDRTQVRGIELSARWHPSPSFSLQAAFLFDDTLVQSASVAPALVGKQLAQVPRQSGSVGATWRAPGGLAVTPRVRWLGRQFEDDQNLLVLEAAVVADVNLAYPVTPQVSIFLTAENLGNARIETGRTAGGPVNTGTPRNLFGGVRVTW